MSNNLSFKDVFIKGAVIYNPVLIQLVGLCPVVAASTSLARAAMLSAVLCIELIVTCVVASALFKKLPRWIRVSLYLIIGVAIICPILWYTETQTLVNLSLGMKIYIPLIAINSMTAVHCEQFSVKNTVKLSLYDAAAAGFGASFIFIIVGAVRELLGSSAIGGIEVNLPIAFKGMALPFGCLFLLGYMAAGLKALVARRYPEYIESREPEVVPEEEYSEEVTEVELFEEFWTESEQAEAVETAPEPAEEIPQEVSVEIPEKPVAEESKERGIGSAADIDDFLKSLGIDFDEKGDKQ